MNNDHSLTLIKDFLRQNIINQEEFDKAQAYFNLSSPSFETHKEALEWLINHHIVSREHLFEYVNPRLKSGAERIKEREIRKKQIRKFKLEMLAYLVAFIVGCYFIFLYEGKPGAAQYGKAIRRSIQVLELVVDSRYNQESILSDLLYKLPYPLNKPPYSLNKLIAEIKVAGKCQFDSTVIHCPITFRFSNNENDLDSQLEKTIMVKFIKSGRNRVRVASINQLLVDLEKVIRE